MFKYVILFLALCLPVVAGETEKVETPRIYSDSWLNIQYCDVKDILKYKGDDQKFTDLKEKLKTNKYTYGILVLNVSSKMRTKSYKVSDYLKNGIVLKIDKSKLSSVKDFQMWLKNAKAEKSYNVFYNGCNKKYKLGNSFSWVLPTKPKEYTPES